MTNNCKECAGDLQTDRVKKETYCIECGLIVEKSPPSLKEGDGSGTHGMNKDIQEHTHAASEHTPNNTTFYADDADNTFRFNKLWKLDSGYDEHKCNSDAERHKADTNWRLKVEEAECIASAADLNVRHKNLVMRTVKNHDFRTTNYLGSIPHVVAGMIYCIDERGGLQAAEAVGISKSEVIDIGQSLNLF